jgi:uncharacterized SAM-binding protein YcdF (DUF218 family)
LAATAPAWLPRIGTFLEVRDPLAPADAIVVLAGNAPLRLRHGNDLYQAGYAPVVIISDERVRTHGLNVAWHELYDLGLAAADLPHSAAVLLTDPPPASTIDEAQRDAALLRQRGARSVILVTDPFHSRRARRMFAAQLGRYGIQVRSSPSPPDRVDLARWWTDRYSTRTVVQEWIKLLWYGPQGVYW